MKRLGKILRYIVVSGECLVSLSGFALYLFCPRVFVWLTERVGQQAELLKYFGLLPVALMVYDLTLLKSILLPDADRRTILQNWRFYGDLKCVCIVGLFFAITFVVAGIISLLFDWKTPAAHQSALLVTSIVGALTVSGTLFFAHIKIEELFRHHSMRGHSE